MRLTSSKILVDTGDPAEAQAVQELLKKNNYEGLDGATTNPSYFAKSSKVKARVERGEKYSKDELLSAYQETIIKLAEIIPQGDISIEVYADINTPVNDIVEQAREMSSWIPTARIKLPIIKNGLEAAIQLKDEIRLNMTLCFTQSQAAAVYAATINAREPIFISPFIGRLDDQGKNGAQFVANIIKMFASSDHHVQVLAASFRSVDNIMEMLHQKADVITINLERFQLWADQGFQTPDQNYRYNFIGESVPYQDISLTKDWDSYDLQSDLTDISLQRFVDDWNNLLK